MLIRLILLFIGSCFLLTSPEAEAQIHDAPIILKGFQIRRTTKYPIKSYALFQTNSKGEATPIPFQIDEVNRLGDYILDQGPQHNLKSSNGLFDTQDELVFMGNDVGPAIPPQKFPQKKPDDLFEIKFKNSHTKKEGAVYLGVFLKDPPPKSDRKYTIYSPPKATITTSRYKYFFDHQNYLVLTRVDSNPTSLLGKKPMTILDSSTFFLKADLKYFLTFEANHRSVSSELEAFKAGPVRVIVRVNFYYTLLKLNFEAGMYTEVSFFSNSVILPAILYSPIDGTESLNEDSYFYYGFAFRHSPSQYELASNMNPWPHPMNHFSKQKNKLGRNYLYWGSLVHDQHMVYLEIKPSRKLHKMGAEPLLYVNKAPSGTLKADNDDILDLDKAPVNLGVAFDLTKFPEGENVMSFKLFFENYSSPKQLDSFKNLWQWYHRVKKLP